MTPNELRLFMSNHQIGKEALANLLGVTPMAVIHWVGGKRAVSLTVARILRLFDKRPELMKEFGS